MKVKILQFTFLVNFLKWKNSASAKTDSFVTTIFMNAALEKKKIWRNHLIVESRRITIGSIPTSINEPWQVVSVISSVRLFLLFRSSLFIQSTTTCCNCFHQWSFYQLPECFSSNEPFPLISSSLGGFCFKDNICFLALLPFEIFLK